VAPLIVTTQWRGDVVETRQVMCDVRDEKTEPMVSMELALSTQEARNLILEMAATCSHSSGRKWPQVAANILLSPAATCSHLQPLEWLQVAASGRQHSLVTGSHLQPLAATRVAASGRKWPPDILPRKLFHIFRGHLRPLGHLQPLEWPQVAA